MSKLSITKDFSSDSDLVLYNGDCLDLFNKIPDNLFKLVVTSPPYNIGKEYEEKMELKEYLDFQKKVIDESVRVLRDDGSICWQVGNYVDNGEIIPLDILIYPIFQTHNLKLRNRIVWHFGHGLHAKNRFSGRYEVILWFTKTDNYTFNLDSVRVPPKYPKKKYYKGPKKGQYSCNPLGKNPSDIWNIPNVKSNHVEKTVHPAQFPVELIERLVLSMTNEGDWVLDPFMGVGSTQIASIMHHRRSVGAEILQKYYQIAWERIEKAQEGTLRVRPMNRPVYDPNSPKSNYIPPKTVQIEKKQKVLFPKK
jgi:adenine-specific DNA-methyltransferase